MLAAKAVGSLLPGAAPVLALLDIVVRPGMNRRWAEWIRAVDWRLRRLEKKFDGFSFGSLEKDEEFLSVLAQASQAAMKTHVAEKRQFLANVVVRAAADPIDFDLEAAFVRFIDELAPLHVHVLAFVAANGDMMAQVELVGSMKLLRRRYLETQGAVGATSAEFEMAIADLRARALLRVSDHLRPYGSVLRTMPEGPNTPLTSGGSRSWSGEALVEVSDLGKQFLAFLRPIDPEALQDNEGR